jgi:hypothetical protein
MNEHTNSPVPVSQLEAKPLTNWKQPPTIAELKQDLMDAKPIHDSQVTKINTWLDNLNVTGKAKVVTPAGNSAIVPKLIRKQAEWRYAALSEPFLSTDDVFNVKPVTWEDREAAKQNQLLLNHQFNNVIDKTRFVDEYVRAAVDEGTVVVKVGWDYEDEEYIASVPDVEFRVNPELGPLHQHLAQLKAESPSQYATDVPDELKEAHDLSVENGQPIEPVIKGQKQEKKTRIKKNVPTLEVCDARNVVFDPTCMGDYTKAGFAVESFESSLSVLRKDSKYKNLDKINIGANSILGTPDHIAARGMQSFNFSDEPRKKFVVHQYWGFRDIDGSGKVKPIVAAWVGDTLIRMEENPFPDEALPFIVEQYLPVRRSNYGEPDGELLEDNQKVIGAVTRGMIDIMGKSANGQTGLRKDMLDTTNRRKFDKGQDYEYNPNVDPRQGVYMHTYPEIPNSAQFMLQLQNMEAESLTGVKSWSQGVSGANLGDVAVGVRGALDAASKRELGILRRLSSGVIKIGRKLISMNAVFLSDEEVVRVTNDEFVKIRKDDLPGNFDLKLSISTAEEDDNKAQQLAFLLQTVGPNSDPEMVKMILADIARLRKMPDMAKKIEAYQPQPDPVAQKMQELTIAKLEAEIAEIQAKTQKTMADAGLAQAKAGTEEVKQGQLKSDTDLMNLDFVEQESGVKQERDLQKAGEQARSNMQLKAMDNQMRREDHRNDLLKEYVKNKQKKS